MFLIWYYTFKIYPNRTVPMFVCNWNYSRNQIHFLLYVIWGEIFLEQVKLARPIKETPVITGKDEKRFAEKMANLKFESKEEKEAAKKVYEKF